MRLTTRLRQMLHEPGIIVAPGAYDCLTARLIEREGFPAVYMTGAGTSVASYGYPDLGLVTMTEMVANAGRIAGAVDVPVIADADTGYGEVLSIARTVREYERSGVAAMHIEDQESPKRCGHLDDKRVIPVGDMVRKIRAAVDARADDDFVIIVRTDALAVTGWDDTMSRCDAYVGAGADVLFVEALRTREEVERVARNFRIPLLYNCVETGKSPLIPVPELERDRLQARYLPGHRHTDRLHGGYWCFAGAETKGHHCPPDRQHGQLTGLLRNRWTVGDAGPGRPLPSGNHVCPRDRLARGGVSPRNLIAFAQSLSKGAAHGELVEPRAGHCNAVFRNEALATYRSYVDSPGTGMKPGTYGARQYGWHPSADIDSTSRHASLSHRPGGGLLFHQPRTR